MKTETNVLIDKWTTDNQINWSIDRNNDKELWRADERNEPENNSIPYSITIPHRGYCEPIADICAFPPTTEGNLKRKKDQALLLVTAVNNCKSINPDNPLKVAELLPDIFQAFENVIYSLHDRKQGIPLARILNRITRECEQIIKQIKP